LLLGAVGRGLEEVVDVGIVIGLLLCWLLGVLDGVLFEGLPPAVLGEQVLGAALVGVDHYGRCDPAMGRVIG
jgi:hypothetical protein